MHTENFWPYRLFLSDESDGSFFLDDRLPVFADWIVPTQVHENMLIRIESSDELSSADLSQADGIISPLSGKIFGVKLADCNGVIFLGEKWYAVVHAGWKGLRSGILEKAIESLTLEGEKTDNLSVFCSPSLRACCYEVGDEFLGYFPGYCVMGPQGKYHFDAIAYMGHIFSRYGIPKDHVQVHPACTKCETDFYSYRRDQNTNRLVFGVQKT